MISVAGTSSWMLIPQLTTVNTRRCAPSSSRDCRRTTPLTNTAIPTGACGNWSIAPDPRCARVRLPPFSRAEGRQAGAHRRPPRAHAAPSPCGRCPDLLVPRDDGAAGDPRGGPLRLLAAPGATGLRRAGPAGRLPGFGHGPGHLGPVEPAGPEVDRQGTAQSHQ